MAKDFLDHYFQPTASGAPTPVAGRPAPIDVDKSWYMDEGPGRYYHPGMFPVIHQIMGNRNLAPGTYDLAMLANEKDDLKAPISHYTTDVRSPDYPLRAFVFGNESAKVFGQVVVDGNGSKTFKQIDIQPFDTNFDFEHNTLGPIAIAREVARRTYDPEGQGTSYGIRYRGPGAARGTGRIYDTFTDAQLDGALRKASAYPDRMPAGLLSSVTGKPELPFVDQYQRYLDHTNGGQPPPSPANVGTFAARFPSPAGGNASGSMTNWIAGLAGVDLMNPTQPAPTGGIPSISSNKPVRYANPANGRYSPVPVFESISPITLFVLPDHLKPTRSVTDWIARLAGIDPQNPAQPAPSSPADQLGGFYRDDRSIRGAFKDSVRR